MRRKARSRWVGRFALGAIALLGAIEVMGLIFLFNVSLTGSLVVDFLLAVWQSANIAFFVRENTRPVDPALRRFPYQPTQRDKRLIWTTFAALSVPVIAVLVVVMAHSLA